MSTNNSNGDRPSLRLNLSAAVAAAAASNNSSSNNNQSAAASASGPPPPLKKKARTTFTPPTDTTSIPAISTNPAQLQLLHQRIQLSFAYHQHAWYGVGETTLYLIDQAAPPAGLVPPAGAGGATARAGGTMRQLALHGRGLLEIQSVSVHTPMATTTESAAKEEGEEDPWKSCPASCFHADPLQNVLVQPASTFGIADEENEEEPLRCQADTQCTRAAVGMTNGLRAASIASHFGEIRINYDPSGAAAASSTSSTTPTNNNNNNNEAVSSTTTTATTARLKNLWLADLQRLPYGQVHRTVQEKQNHREGVRQKRFLHVSQRLATPPKGSVALKVHLRFTYKLDPGQAVQHFGGIHAVTALASNGRGTPHMYTTSGTFGDGQGPRTWVPTLDSAAVVHRASRECIIFTTGPAAAALQCLGAGETFGTSLAYGHESMASCKHHPTNENLSKEASSPETDREARLSDLKQLLGESHVRFLQGLPIKTATRSGGPDVIPPERLSWSVLQVTQVFSSACWAPVPARSWGWAIGPFGIVEDPEYFQRVLQQAQEEEEDDDGDLLGDMEGAKSKEERLAELMAKVRKAGEGIWQAYFLPKYARVHVYTKKADWTLLKNPTFRLKALTRRQKDDAQSWEDIVTRATVGVPHRALSLTRDVLALPTYRTVSYIQIWIPNAIDGGCTSGSMADCPEVSVNPFLGGAIADARLLPPPQARLPYATGGGRVLQYIQARAAIRGWVRAALPLGGDDDVGFGYLHHLVEVLLFSLYERGHGGYGEGGGKGGFFYSRRYAPSSGLNSSQLDFLPIRNVEDLSFVGGVAAVPIEERQTDYLWRSTVNGSESHTSALDEFQVRSMIGRDVVEALERGVDKDHNATSSSLLGCGAVELMHPVSGLVYQNLKTSAFQGIVEGRAGIANFVRLIRAAFIAAHLSDLGEKELKLPQRRSKKEETQKSSGNDKSAEEEQPKPPFVVCVNEILTKKGLTHTLFTRALQNMCGRLREPFLAGTLVDVERNAVDPRTRQPFVEPEGFPNSYVRAASTMFCRVGVQVEQSRAEGASAANKNTQCQLYAEPIVPEGGVAFGGHITVRIVENEGQFHEYMKELVPDGSRRDWGSQMLHTKPVTTIKAQNAASGTIEKSPGSKSNKSGEPKGGLTVPSTGSVFTESNFHIGGYQAIELIRLTNLTPLLWVRVDPLGLYGGKISVFQPDACLAEQLFYDGDASAQLDAIRSLAERPLLFQSSTKVKTVYDVNVSELPIRVLGDCLRGSPALHSSLPHTPVVRAQAAMAMAQWQNNKAPQSRDEISPENWIGLNLLMQYFKERYYSNSVIMPVKFTRIAFKKNEAETRAAAAANSDSGAGVPKATHDDGFYYFDSLMEGEERAAAISEAEDVETEEDEEYRVRSACVTAIASVRAKDGQTPPAAVKFLETVLEAENASTMGNVVHPDDDMVVENTFRKLKAEGKDKDDEDDDSDDAEEEDDVPLPSLSYVSSMLVADTLLALCHVNIAPATYTDPGTGEVKQYRGTHPVSRLMELALEWLEWELYREDIRRDVQDESRTGISGNCYDLVAPCAILAIVNLGILRQSTTEVAEGPESELTPVEQKLAKVTRTSFYADIFDSPPPRTRSDLTKAAAAQAFTSLCCASDRIKDDPRLPLGLLTGLEFLLERIVEAETSPSLRHTLAALMMDACTGKIASMQRVGAIAGRNDLFSSAARFYTGPLGASHGGDNGSAVVMSVSASTHPSASSVNDGARRGLKLLTRAGHPRETFPDAVVVRVAIFATRLWRTINGEKPEPTPTPSVGVCAYDGSLRCSLLALWQWLWPKGCTAVLRVQDWNSGPPGSEKVMSITDEEKKAALAEETSLTSLSRLVDHEIDRQAWRGEMAGKAHEVFKSGKKKVDVAAAEQGLGQPLPPIKRDAAFKQGGWIASWAQQRRETKLDGGSTVSRVRLTVGGT